MMLGFRKTLVNRYLVGFGNEKFIVAVQEFSRWTDLQTIVPKHLKPFVGPFK